MFGRSTLNCASSVGASVGILGMTDEATTQRLKACMQDVSALPSSVRRALAEMAALDAQVATAYSEASSAVAKVSSSRQPHSSAKAEEVARRVALLSQTAEECGERRVSVAKALQATLSAIDRDILSLMSDVAARIHPAASQHTDVEAQKEE